MSLEQWMAGGVKTRCWNCDTVLKSPIRKINGKPYCRECYFKKIGKKPEKEKEE